ncbi:HlyD family secretion protein [Rubripirellula amarantea]|nr:efflux RND transporter periplasmic adaptor subunit [Rubripirellula amarantea]
MVENRRIVVLNREPATAKLANHVQRYDTIRAAGIIEGRTELVEILARITEQISRVAVSKGQWVRQGDVLIELDSERYVHERNLANAMLQLELAKKQRLENGFRPSEIETARHEHDAIIARLDAATKNYQRGVKLSKNKAISNRELENLQAEVASLKATASAAKGRLETLELPARSDDLLAASASVRAAEARLQIAQISLDRCTVRAPSDGRVMIINGEPGELTGPDRSVPLVVMSDTSSLRTVADIDEFDALRISVGQSCDIYSDAAEGIIASGKTIEIEPLMDRKKLFGQFAGERNDTNSRRVWIELQNDPDLPIGLPVDVYIKVNSQN